MPRRKILTERQSNKLLALPDEQSILMQHYILSDDDLNHIRKRHGDNNRLGFALQLCAFRYPGRYLNADDVLSIEMVSFVGTQINLSERKIAEFVYKPATRYEHLKILQKHYGFRQYTVSKNEMFGVSTV